jgi:cytidylate kinase
MADNFAHNDMYSATAERRIKQWQCDHEKPAARLAEGAEINYITISREAGSGGEEIAEKLTELMGWGLYDKKILDFMAENFGIHKDVLSSVDEKTRGWIEDTMSSFFAGREGHMDQLTYYKHLMEALLVIGRHGRAVIVGRAAGHVLPRDKGLSIRITAPFELRCQRYAKKENLSIEQASEAVKQADREQSRFLKSFLYKDVHSIRYYDLIFSTEKLTPQSVAKLIWRAFDQRIESSKQQAQMNAQGHDVNTIVERQMAQWDQEKDDASIGEKEQQIHLSDGTEIDYVTVGRDAGSGGAEVAQMLADLMQWKLYDKEIIDYMAENMNVHVKVLSSVDEQTVGKMKQWLGSLFSNTKQVTPQSYYEHLGEVLLVIARHKNAVIVGRAAGLILPRDKGLSIRVTAPFNLRCKRYAKEYSISIEKAASAVKKADKAQRNFVKDFLGEDLSDPKHYDIVCNTEKLYPISAAQLVCRAFDQRVISQQKKKLGPLFDK